MYGATSPTLCRPTPTTTTTTLCSSLISYPSNFTLRSSIDWYNVYQSRLILALGRVSLVCYSVSLSLSLSVSSSLALSLSPTSLPQPVMTSDSVSNAPFVSLQPAVVAAVPVTSNTPRAYRLVPVVLVVAALLTAALLLTFGPNSWYRRTASPTTTYANSVCQRASQSGDSVLSYTLCSAPADNDRCCPIGIGYGAEAMCLDDGMSCYGYNQLQRFVITVVAWVGFAVSLCVLCCCMACLRRPSMQPHYQHPQQAADGVYLVVENSSGSYGRLQ